MTLEIELYAMDTNYNLIYRRAEIILINSPKTELTYESNIQIAAFSPY